MALAKSLSNERMVECNLETKSNPPFICYGISYFFLLLCSIHQSKTQLCSSNEQSTWDESISESVLEVHL